MKEKYEFPDYALLSKNNKSSKINYEENKKEIENFFRNHKIDIECKDVYFSSNSITYVVDLKSKTRVKTIESYKEDIMMIFGVRDVKFDIAINGTSYLGIIMIKMKTDLLRLGDLIENNAFKNTKAKIPLILGESHNNVIIEDLSKLTHLLIGGTVGTGKSNLLSTFIIDMIYKLSPEEVKLILVDTRMTNLHRFDGIPHLLIPVISDVKRVIGAIQWLICEMNVRHTMFERLGVDNINEYNKKSVQKLPRIVLIIEDFGDLMIYEKDDIEENLTRLIQMSRASGIDVIISTQRPSTDVITGVIKANILARIAFKVPSKIDSKTILDTIGAEQLISIGSILFKKIGLYDLKEIQTPYISDQEIKDIIKCVKRNNPKEYDEKISEEIWKIDNGMMEKTYQGDDDTDPLLEEAIECVVQERQVSVSFIQRMFKVGYARAGRIMDQMEERGIISGYLGNSPREVLMSKERWNELNNRMDKIQKDTKEMQEKLEIEHKEKEETKNIREDELNKEKIEENIFNKWWFWVLVFLFIAIIIGNL